jgi:hypothetical protein
MRTSKTVPWQAGSAIVLFQGAGAALECTSNLLPMAPASAGKLFPIEWRKEQKYPSGSRSRSARAFIEEMERVMHMKHCIGVWISAIILAPGLSVAAKGESCKDLELRQSCSQQAADLFTAIQLDNQELIDDIQHRHLDHRQAILSDMREQVRKLEALQGDFAPWEQEMSAQVAGQVSQMTANGDQESLSGKAQALARTLRVDAHAARVDARAEYLAPNLGMTEAFR